MKTMDIPVQLASMAKMTATQLREKHVELFGEESRSGNRQWLYRRCAWRLQALAAGDLSDRARERARELARDVDVRVRPPSQQSAAAKRPVVVRPAPMSHHDARLPMPGTCLKREYKGEVYEVEVLDGGFAFGGQVYRSLSAIAHAITGAHWNGFLFFGLADPRKEQR